MVGIAVATMGVGTLVEGGLVGLGWTAAGFGSAAAFGTTLVVSAAEAASFTILSRQLLESDPQNSVILEFLMNWGLFTAMKGLTAGYEAFVGAEEAATVGRQGHGPAAAVREPPPRPPSESSTPRRRLPARN